MLKKICTPLPRLGYFAGKHFYWKNEKVKGGGKSRKEVQEKTEVKEKEKVEVGSLIGCVHMMM